jgi:phosphoglycolate phosphatase-like HAD superfamily hydrolase
MKILLLDMDGVLVHARAYHRALQDTVSLIGKALGYQNVALTQDVIELIESVGVTSEWDSSAICSALMMQRVWQEFPFIFLHSDPPLPEVPRHSLQPPDFKAFYSSPAMSSMSELSGLVRAERILLSDDRGHNPSQVEALRSLLQGARSIKGSITHRLFQEFVLGSDIFNTFYGLQPYLQVEGYLLVDDESTLSLKMHSQLLDWLNEPEHVVAIFTNRPSKPLQGYIDTPEAELGLKAIGLEGLPLVGHGGLAWLAERRGMVSEALLKPSAVHVLAGLAHASGLSLQESLELSASLALEGREDLIWQNLEGSDVYVIEDSIKGLHSGKSARELLLDMGIRINLHLVGVSKSINKQQALKAAGAQQVFEDINAVLEMIL